MTMSGCSWRSWFYGTFLFFISGPIAPAVAAQNEYTIGPPPEWVERMAPDDAAPVPTGQVSQGVYYLLSSQQTRVEGNDRALYRHFAMKALNENGVESIAHVEVGFNPAYHRLTLHEINVRRDGRVIPKLSAAAVRVLQREKELEYRIFDGSKTANVFLDDIRVGDVVEYAYTLRGTNPVFGGKLFGRFDLQWNVPVHRLHARLLVPVGREIHFGYQNTKTKPAVRERDGMREYRWEGKKISALVVENDAPGWYDPYPWVQWSEFSDWGSVARWAEPLYRLPERLTPALQAQADRIKRVAATPPERLLAALRFVQSEIRYLGVEIGAGSHAPSAPHIVLERRFGDCKDKTLLTMTLLRALGIESRAALVHTSTRRGIRDLYPTPVAFNHVLVRARLDGRDYWIDPTRAPQKGGVENLPQSDYGYALVIDTATRALTPMPNPPANTYKRTIRSVLDARGAQDQPVRYTITSVFEGASAESLRNALAAENREQLQKKYLNFYARYYPGITIGTPFTVVDEDGANRLTVTEQYLVPEFWKRAETHKRLEAQIYVPDVDDYLRPPRVSVRQSPMALSHPVDLTHTTEVLLPDSWDIEPDHTKVVDPTFEFERRITLKDKLLVFADRFRSRADHVTSADTARYVANLERARDAAGYVLYQYDEVAPAASPPAAAHSVLERFNWSVALVAIMMLALWIVLAAKLYRYDPPPPAAPIDMKLHGIRGWLILPAIGVVVHPLRVMYETFADVSMYAADTWAGLTTIGNAAYHPLWAPVLLYELGANLAIVVFALLLLVMFFQKRRLVPLLYLGVVGGSVTIHAVDLALTSSIPAAAAEIAAKDWRELGRGIAVVAIWGSYFLVSRRVKATFVNGRDGAPTPAAAASSTTS